MLLLLVVLWLLVLLLLLLMVLLLLHVPNASLLGPHIGHALLWAQLRLGLREAWLAAAAIVVGHHDAIGGAISQIGRWRTDGGEGRPRRRLEEKTRWVGADAWAGLAHSTTGEVGRRRTDGGEGEEEEERGRKGRDGRPMGFGGPVNLKVEDDMETC